MVPVCDEPLKRTASRFLLVETVRLRLLHHSAIDFAFTKQSVRAQENRSNFSALNGAVLETGERGEVSKQQWSSPFGGPGRVGGEAPG
jgi:hypothetical protein